MVVAEMARLKLARLRDRRDDLKPEVIRLMRRTCERAERGEIRSAVLLTVKANGDTSSAFELVNADDSLRMVGNLELVKNRILRGVLRDEEG